MRKLHIDNWGFIQHQLFAFLNQYKPPPKGCVVTQKIKSTLNGKKNNLREKGYPWRGMLLPFWSSPLKTHSLFYNTPYCSIWKLLQSQRKFISCIDFINISQTVVLFLLNGIAREASGLWSDLDHGFLLLNRNYTSALGIAFNLKETWFTDRLGLFAETDTSIKNTSLFFFRSAGIPQNIWSRVALTHNTKSTACLLWFVKSLFHPTLIACLSRNSHCGYNMLSPNAFLVLSLKTIFHSSSLLFIFL